VPTTFRKTRQGRPAACFEVHPTLRQKIRTSELSQTALAFPVGLSQTRISLALHGDRFSKVTQAKFEALGAALGLPPELCTRYVGRRRS
jgi:hypothetical protein